MGAIVTEDHAWLQHPVQRASVYNLWDVYNTARLRQPLREQLKDNQQLAFYEKEVWPLVEVVMQMQRRGFYFRKEARDELRMQLREELRSTEAEIRTVAGWTGAIRPDPLNSPPKKAWLLYEKLGLKPSVRRGVETRSTDQEALSALLKGLRKKDAHAKPVLEKLFHRSRLHTILTRYLDVEVDTDNRVRATIKLYGAETGRLAYANPAIQQYPKEARVLYGAPPGKIWIAGDFSQLEARILAVLSQDHVSLAVFAAGGDVHTQNAQDLLGLSQTQWDDLPSTTRSAARNLAKSFLYGISYGGDPQSLKSKLFCPCPHCAEKVQTTLTVGRDEMTAASQRWFHIHAPVLRFRDSLGEEARVSKRYVSPLGRIRYLCTPWPRCKTELYNLPMQCTAADIINRVMCRLHYHYQAPLHLQMHDELVLEVDDTPSSISYWASILKKEMEEEVPELRTSFPIDLKMGTVWGQFKPIPAEVLS